MAFLARASLNSSFTTRREYSNLQNPCIDLKIENTFANKLSCRTPIPKKSLIAMASSSAQSAAVVSTPEPRNAGTSIMVDFCIFHPVVSDFNPIRDFSECRSEHLNSAL